MNEPTECARCEAVGERSAMHGDGNPFGQSYLCEDCHEHNVDAYCA